jgi:ferric-dicitrate binding protein FerR (iron transport regulator)
MNEMTMQKITVPAGQQISLELFDGTLVRLNARSTIQYSISSFFQKERRIHLDGEAYFEVTHDEKRPFIVETNRGNIEVLGTKFYVDAYSDNPNFVTSLIEGSIKIVNENTQLYLKPNQMAVWHEGGFKISSIEDYNVFRWTEGLICFTNETVPSILSEFEKAFGMEFKIENKNLLTHKYTGKFRIADGISYALKVLQKDIDFEFEKDPDNSIIYIK